MALFVVGVIPCDYPFCFILGNHKGEPPTVFNVE